MGVKQILNNVAYSNLKFKLYKVGAFDPSHFFQTTAIYMSGPIHLGLPSYAKLYKLIRVQEENEKKKIYI